MEWDCPSTDRPTSWYGSSIYDHQLRKRISYWFFKTLHELRNINTFQGMSILDTQLLNPMKILILSIMPKLFLISTISILGSRKSGHWIVFIYEPLRHRNMDVYFVCLRTSINYHLDCCTFFSLRMGSPASLWWQCWIDLPKRLYLTKQLLVCHWDSYATRVINLKNKKMS